MHGKSQRAINDVNLSRGTVPSFHMTLFDIACEMSDVILKTDGIVCFFCSKIERFIVFGQ